MLRKSTLIAIFIFLITSPLFAVENIETGYDLYRNLKLIDNIKGTDEVDIVAGFFAVGLLKGILDGLILMQDIQYNSMFPSNMMTETERTEISNKMNFHRLNIPKKGIATGQLILIYNKYAEKHPKKLSGTVRVCVFESLVESYGWK